jgi:hypothetical protein
LAMTFSGLRKRKNFEAEGGPYTQTVPAIKF